MVADLCTLFDSVDEFSTTSDYSLVFLFGPTHSPRWGEEESGISNTLCVCEGGGIGVLPTENGVGKGMMFLKVESNYRCCLVW